MRHLVRTPKDLAWLLAHTRGFQRGQITDLHIHKERLLDEATGRDIPAATVVTAIVRYDPMIQEGSGILALTRVAKLAMLGVSDFSVFEQDGTDFAELHRIHAEVFEGRFRFWFDPHGELYVICDEILFEEITRPGSQTFRPSMREWTFQAQAGELPPVSWFLERLDRAGQPCAWREIKRTALSHPAMTWEGLLLPASPDRIDRPNGVHVQVYGPLDGSDFGITLRAQDPEEQTRRLLITLADLIASQFAGTCLAGTQVMQGDDWLHRQPADWWLTSDRVG